MNPENTLILLLLNKDNYNKYSEYIDLKHLDNNYRELSFIYKALIQLHNNTEHNITLNDLRAYFFTIFPDSDEIIYGAIFDRLAALDISEDAAPAILAAMERRKTLLELSQKAFNVAQGNAEFDSLQPVYESLSA